MAGQANTPSQSRFNSLTSIFGPKTRVGMEVTRRAALGSVKLGLTAIAALYLLTLYSSELRDEAESDYLFQYRLTGWIAYGAGVVIEGGLSLFPEKDLWLLPWWNALIRFFMALIIKNLMLIDVYELAAPNGCGRFSHHFLHHSHDAIAGDYDDNYDDDYSGLSCAHMSFETLGLLVLIVPAALISGLNEYQKYAQNSDISRKIYRRLQCHPAMEKFDSFFSKLPLTFSTMSGGFACVDALFSAVVLGIRLDPSSTLGQMRGYTLKNL